MCILDSRADSNHPYVLEFLIGFFENYWCIFCASKSINIFSQEVIQNADIEIEKKFCISKQH